MICTQVFSLSSLLPLKFSQLCLRRLNIMIIFSCNLIFNRSFFQSNCFSDFFTHENISSKSSMYHTFYYGHGEKIIIKNISIHLTLKKIWICVVYIYFSLDILFSAAVGEGEMESFIFPLMTHMKHPYVQFTHSF